MTDEQILEHIPRIAAVEDQVEQSLREWVGRLRDHDVTWERIGAALGMTRQSAWDASPASSRRPTSAGGRMSHRRAGLRPVPRHRIQAGEHITRRGMAAALLDVAVQRAGAAGCYKIQLLSRMSREAAHALYESADSR
jgi:hypothetical protein